MNLMDKIIYTEEELPQRSPEWLEVRKSCIGGSDVAKVLAINANFDSPYKFWCRKTGKLKPIKSNKAMQRGALLEPEALKEVVVELQRDFGVVNPKIEQFFALHPEKPHIGVSFDGVDIENKYIVEIKCPSVIWNFRHVFESGIQDYYYPQVQLQLYVANALWGIKTAYFCSYYPDGAFILNYQTYKEEKKTLAVLDVDYDEEYCTDMVKVIDKFYDFYQYDHWDGNEYEQYIEDFRVKWLQ